MSYRAHREKKSDENDTVRTDSNVLPEPVRSFDRVHATQLK